MFASKFFRVSVVEVWGVVEFGMAHSRCIRPNHLDPLAPLAPWDKYLVEVCRMGAVDAVVDRR